MTCERDINKNKLKIYLKILLLFPPKKWVKLKRENKGNYKWGLRDSMGISEGFF